MCVYVYYVKIYYKMYIRGIRMKLNSNLSEIKEGNVENQFQINGSRACDLSEI
jgi:hypothetical protein